MCRIAGYWDRSGAIYDMTAVANKMRDALERGGPDDAGLFLDVSLCIALGHRRLSIIDLSEAGSQPMRFQELVIIFNGELYNYREIRTSLESLGYTFDSSSDTEVVVKAFHCWGKECVKRFHGFWALAIFDRANNELHLCRDRVGVKPIYYYLNDGLFAFASELKGLHQHPAFRPDLREGSTAQMIQYGFIGAPHTIYKHTYKIRPGHWLSINNTLTATEYKYWELPSVQIENKPDEEWLREANAILHKTVRMRMVADVPIGVFLSGGVDSSLVAALLQSQQQAPLSTFTIGFNNEDFNEALTARKIAKHLGTEHHEWICADRDALDLITLLPTVFDEPFGDASAIPTLMLAKKSSAHIKVALSADGGDELFAGYQSFYEVLNSVSPIHRATSLSYHIASLFGQKSALRWDVGAFEKNHRRQFLASDATITSKLMMQMSLCSDPLIQALLPNEIEKVGYQLAREYDSHLGTMSAWDFKNYLPEDVMVKVDRTTMYYALEGREPLLDQELIEFAFRLPDHMKYRNGKGKYILRTLLSSYLPDDIVQLPKKGFTPPLAQWFKSDLKDLLRHYLDANRIRRQEIFDHNTVALLLTGMNKGVIHPKLIWNLLMFQMWHEKYMES